MNLGYLQEVCAHWSDLLVIGRTIERDGNRYHIVGMTQGEETKLYIIEPNQEPEHRKRAGKENERKLLKRNEPIQPCYLGCREICIGTQKMQVRGGSGTPLEFAAPEREEVQVMLAMMRAGWVVPEWLCEINFKQIQLVTLELDDVKELPTYMPDMPITIQHGVDSIRHLLEKTVTLPVWKTKQFHFIDHTGEEVTCYINRVLLVDLWKDADERFQDPRYKELLTEEQFEDMKRGYYKDLENSCPKGMCYAAIEYECTKDISLQFYSKEYLRSDPEQRDSAMLMMWKPEQKTGVHGLPLKGEMLDTPVAADTTKIPAEAFFYFENVEAWEETV